MPLLLALLALPVLSVRDFGAAGDGVRDDTASFQQALNAAAGEYVSCEGPNPVMVRVAAAHRGSVRFVNSAFWGPCEQIARIEGTGTVGFRDCTFVQWDRSGKGRLAR